MTNSVTFNYTAAVTTVVALVISLFAFATPASAFYMGGNGGSDTDNEVTITVKNSGHIINNTSADAKTGGNYAGGSAGGNGENGGTGGAGGDVEGNKGGDDNTGGNGGNGGAGGEGGDAGPGGIVLTGDASADAGTVNTVNLTDVEVDQADCGCESTGNSYPSWMWWKNTSSKNKVDNKVMATVENTGSIFNNTSAKAKTGFNKAEGSTGGSGDVGGSGGAGGDVKNNWGFSGGFFHLPSFGSDDNTGGNGGNAGKGGNGGNGALGGQIGSGNAAANAGTVNLVNSSIVRVN